jgi:hypothetical protein
MSVQIRGGTEWMTKMNLCMFVDGSIVDDLTYVNLNDVEKVDILKDGSIFGTKRGQRSHRCNHQKLNGPLLP